MQLLDRGFDEVLIFRVEIQTGREMQHRLVNITEFSIYFTHQEMHGSLSRCQVLQFLKLLQSHLKHMYHIVMEIEVKGWEGVMSDEE